MNKKGALPEDFLNDWILSSILLIIFILIFAFYEPGDTFGLEIKSIQEGISENEANLLLMTYLRSEVPGMDISFSDLIILVHSDSSYYDKLVDETKKWVKDSNYALNLEVDKINLHVSEGALGIEDSLSGSIQVELGTAEIYLPIEGDMSLVKLEMNVEVGE